MDNVAKFSSTRSKALVAVDDMDPADALKMHTAIKSRGRGAITEFVENETPYGTYGNYYYRMKKIGVMPMKPQGSKGKSQQKQQSNPLEERIKQLEMQLQNLNTSTGHRAAKIAAAAYEQLNYKTRKFLGDMIVKDLPTHTLSYKQEAWLANLESKFEV